MCVRERGRDVLAKKVCLSVCLLKCFRDAAGKQAVVEAISSSHPLRPQSVATHLQLSSSPELINHLWEFLLCSHSHLATGRGGRCFMEYQVATRLDALSYGSPVCFEFEIVCWKCGCFNRVLRAFGFHIVHGALCRELRV